MGLGAGLELRHPAPGRPSAPALVTHVHPPDELLDKALELAGSIAAKGRWAVAETKRLCNLALGDLPGPLARELDAFALAFSTEDQREGMDAFFEKRPPRFSGLEAD